LKIPTITSKYIPVYSPSADIFPGPDSAFFKAGASYENWIPNDFTVVRAADKRWHMIGITHPAPADFISHSDYNPASIHDGEWQLFHAVSADAGNEIDTAVTAPYSFADEAKLLPPSARPGEEFNIYAPHVISHDGKYRMFYGPAPIRTAVSDDLYNWIPAGALFLDHPSDRDPHVMPYKDGFIMTYVSENKLFSRLSADLANWSEPVTVFIPDSGVPESPFIVPYDNLFYLFWCIYDGTNGPYDNRTFVYVSDTPERFEKSSCLTTLDAHAPEVIAAGGKGYIFSAEHPQRGICAARIEWL